MASASRNAVNGISKMATFSSSGSPRWRRTRTASHAVTAPASAPPPYARSNSQPVYSALRCSAPAVMPTARL